MIAGVGAATGTRLDLGKEEIYYCTSDTVSKAVPKGDLAYIKIKAGFDMNYVLQLNIIDVQKGTYSEQGISKKYIIIENITDQISRCVDDFYQNLKYVATARNPKISEEELENILNQRKQIHLSYQLVGTPWQINLRSQARTNLKRSLQQGHELIAENISG